MDQRTTSRPGRPEPGRLTPTGLIRLDNYRAGTPALIGGDCIGMDDPAGDAQDDVLIFPHGTRPSKDGLSIVLPDGLEVAVGDQVYGSGGYAEISEHPGVLDDWPDAPASCRGAGTSVGIYDVKLGEAP